MGILQGFLEVANLRLKNQHILAQSLAIFIIVVGIFVVSPKPAHADPHATFFTTVGQQQLFFNVLAALDQADYVERAGLRPGAPPEPPATRQDLLDNREAAGFPAETDERLNATRTNLSSLLTRAVTLEGNDVWTAYLAQQFAIEASRRNSYDQLMNLYCTFALGRADCSDKIDNLVGNKTKQEAFGANPLQQAIRANSAGNIVLDSGQTFDLKNRENATLTRPYDTYVATLYENTRGETNVPRSNAVERIKSGIKSIGNDRVNPYLYDGLIIRDGVATMPDNASLDATISQLQGIINAPNAFLSTSLRASNQVAATEAAKKDSVLAKTKVIKDAEGKHVQEVITAPAEAREAMIAAIADIAGDASTDLKYVPSIAESEPGEVDLVDRPEVAGISTNNQPPLSPQVAGTLDEILKRLDLFSEYTEPKEKLSANTNPGAPWKTAKSRLAVKALTGTDEVFNNDPQEEQPCGFCVDANNIIQSIIDALGSILREWVCRIFKICF